jgi:hypothetical protein
MNVVISTEAYLALVTRFCPAVSYKDILELRTKIHWKHPEIYIKLDRDSFPYAVRIIPLIKNSELKYVTVHPAQSKCLREIDHIKNRYFHNIPHEKFVILDQEIQDYKYERVEHSSGYCTWTIGTEFNYDPKQTVLIRIYHTNGVFVGEVLPDNSGEWIFWPNETRNGAWPSYVLSEIVKCLNQLNGDKGL